jgi:hypothetical protein
MSAFTAKVLADLLTKVCLADRKLKLQRPSLTEWWSAWSDYRKTGFIDWLMFICDSLHYYFLNNPIMGTLCLPLHLFLCCGVGFCSCCRRRKSELAYMDSVTMVLIARARNEAWDV